MSFNFLRVPLCLSVLVVISAGVATAAEPAYPSYTGFVNDFAGVIDTATRDKLKGLCKTLEEKTSAELAIATVKTVAPLDSKTYAVKLFEKWQIGKKGKDNGLLVLLAMEERRVEIEVGYGLEGVINDAKAGEILDKYVVPFFKQGKFGDGLYNGAEALAGQIAQASKQEMGDQYQGYKKTAGEDFSLPAGLIAAFALLFVLAIFTQGAIPGLVGAA